MTFYRDQDSGLEKLPGSGSGIKLIRIRNTGTKVICCLCSEATASDGPVQGPDIEEELGIFSVIERLEEITDTDALLSK